MRTVPALEVVVVCFVLSCIQLASSQAKHCRGKLGTYKQPFFNLHSCAWCYFFLFQTKPLFPIRNDTYLLVIRNGTGFPVGQRLIADYKNATSSKAICSSLTDDECSRWKLCCQAADECCDRQLKDGNDVINGSKVCKSTWDGFGCWGNAGPGSKNHISCPGFIQYSIPTRFAVKTCNPDGSWYKKDGLEWTDYTLCVHYQELRTTIFISLACQLASLILLIPALLIFLQYQSLRRQHRIRLHIHFFLSFICSGICMILWNMLVTYDKLTNPEVTDTLMYKNLASCKLISFLKLYFTSTNYAWMFCEGFYLYRLIGNAFSPPKKLIGLYIAGWGIPFIFVMAYTTARLFLDDTKCWVMSLGAEEWIIYSPNLICILANIFFLCSILRILLTQLQNHPNEPSNFRRALKATFVLIPLFGVQLIVRIYRIPQEIHYERFSEVLSNTQGFFVALIYCFCNGEVLSLMKRSWHRSPCLSKIVGGGKTNTTYSMNFNNSMSQRTTVAWRKNSLEPCLKPVTDTTTCETLVQSTF